MTENSPRTVRVLLIEDNPHVATLITDGLDGAARRSSNGRLAFSFDVVGDGQMALDRLQELEPELIICDIYMPVMDGVVFLRHLRAHAKRSKTPVLALSAGGPSAREAALAAGADQFLDKPIRLNEVLAVVTQLLSPR